MVRMDKNWNLNILYNSQSLLFNSWIIKHDPKQMTLSFSFDIIIWSSFFLEFEIWTKITENTELLIPNQTGLVFSPGLEEGGGGGDW